MSINSKHIMKARDAASADVAATNAVKAAEALMTNNEAAAYLHLSPITLAIWRSTRRYNVPFIMIGRSPRYKKSDLDKYIQDRTFDGTTSPPPEMKRRGGTGRPPKGKQSIRNQKRRVA